MKLNSKVKQIDIFGKPLLLNFGEDGSTHKTLIGGYLSIIYYLCILGFIGFRMNAMILR